MLDRRRMYGMEKEKYQDRRRRDGMEVMEPVETGWMEGEGME